MVNTFCLCFFPPFSLALHAGAELSPLRDSCFYLFLIAFIKSRFESMTKLGFLRHFRKWTDIPGNRGWVYQCLTDRKKWKDNGFEGRNRGNDVTTYPRADKDTHRHTEAALRRDTVSLSLAVLAGLLTFIKDFFAWLNYFLSQRLRPPPPHCGLARTSRCGSSQNYGMKGAVN